MAKQVGWLVWQRLNGRFTAQKASVQCYPSSFPESKKSQQSIEVTKRPLDLEEWKLSLDELKAKYPLPPVEV